MKRYIVLIHFPESSGIPPKSYYIQARDENSARGKAESIKEYWQRVTSTPAFIKFEEMKK